MRVLIVSKTRMWEAFCVGGLLKETNENVRLMQPGGFNQPLTTPYEVGQVWEIDFTKREDLMLPHCEDIIVQHGTCLGHVKNIEETLLNLVDVWQGNPEILFEGLLRFTANGSGYISHRIGLPEQSVGFWITDKSLHKEKDGDRIR